MGPIVGLLLSCGPQAEHAVAPADAPLTPPSSNAPPLLANVASDAAPHPAPNPTACDEFFGTDGRPRAGANILASVEFFGLGGGSRFEIVSPRVGHYVEYSMAPSRSCYKADLSLASIESLRRVLLDHGFCKLQALSERGRERSMPTDAGWLKLEAHLADVSCIVEFAPYAAERADTGDADSWTTTLRQPFRAVFEAFD
jgi:hypothetical protein